MKLIHLVGPITISATMACALMDDTICTTDIQFGLGISVQDSVTGIAKADSTTVVIRDGAYVDSVTYGGSPAGSAGHGFAPQVPTGSFRMAPERPGTYSITVRRPGYQTWTKTGVVVEDATCHVRHVDVLARLVRNS